MTVEQIEIYQNPEALARAAADRFTRVANAALKDAGISRSFLARVISSLEVPQFSI